MSSVCAAQAATVNDPALRVGTLPPHGLQHPTALSFVGNDIGEYFVAEQKGRVVHVSGGVASAVLDLNVSQESGDEGGLVGLALHPDFGHNGFVYLYYTQGDPTADFGSWAVTRLSRFKWDGSQLGGERVLRTFGTIVDGADLRPTHFGGPMLFGPDGKLYGVTGDSGRGRAEQNNTAFADVSAKKGAIYRLNAPGDDTDGSVPADNPFASHPNPDFQPWFAYGVRNSFGLGFDPLTRRLWDTENGGGNYDEVNLVAPGFNSGWSLIMGPDSRNPGSETDLVHLPGSAYSDPEFSFQSSVAPTSIAFLADSVLGDAYRDAVLVAAYNRHGLFLFRLNEARDGFVLSGGLRDLVAEGTAEEEAVRFGSGFGTITDLKVGPDGAVYALNYDLGNIYRITPEPGALGTVSVPALLLLRRRRASS
jgi:glucose/arabinose dehydrogenase